MKQKESVIKHFGFGLGLAAIVCVFVFVTIAMQPIFNPFIYWIWIGFIPVMIYFPHGSHRKFKLYLEMFCSFLLGLVWGWLSNVIANAFGTAFLGHVLDHFIMMFFIFWVSMTLLRKTPFNNLSCSFLAYALVNGAFGRPFPYLGIGFMGNLSPVMIFVLLIAYMVFGLLLTFCIEVLSDVINGWLLKPNKKTFGEWMAKNDVPMAEMKEYLKNNIKE